MIKSLVCSREIIYGFLNDKQSIAIALALCNYLIPRISG